MDDFIFCGRALSEFRAHAFFGKSTIIAGGMERTQYDTGGEELMDMEEARGKTHQVTMTIIPAEGVRATPQWRSEIARWLRMARGEMILANRPDVYRLAQFDGDIRFSRATWPHGALEATATMSKGLYAVRESRIEFEAGSSGSGVICFDTEEARPARITITPMDGSVISGVTLSAGGRRLEISGISCRELLVIDQAAQRASITCDGKNAFAAVKAWDTLQLDSGDQAEAAISYESGGSAAVEVRVRGRWSA